MTESEENFVHYVECVQSLNRAWSILRDLGEIEKPKAVHAAAFRFALVEYANPYTKSRGTHGRRILNAPQLPAELLSIHVWILELRHQVLAHTDLTVKQAQLHISSINNQPAYFISSNYTEKLPCREKVICLIERTLDQMYVESKRLLQLLPATN